MSSWQCSVISAGQQVITLVNEAQVSFKLNKWQEEEASHTHTKWILYMRCALVNYFSATDISFSLIFSYHICLYLHFHILPSVRIGVTEKTNGGLIVFPYWMHTKTVFQNHLHLLKSLFYFCSVFQIFSWSEVLSNKNIFHCLKAYSRMMFQCFICFASCLLLCFVVPISFCSSLMEFILEKTDVKHLWGQWDLGSNFKFAICYLFLHWKR